MNTFLISYEFAELTYLIQIIARYFPFHTVICEKKNTLAGDLTSLKSAVCMFLSAHCVRVQLHFTSFPLMLQTLQ